MNDPAELHEAAALGQKRHLENLLAQGHYDIDSEDWTWSKRTPLHVAVEQGQLKCIRVLLRHGADTSAQTKTGWTPAHFAAETGDTNCLKLLMEHSAPMDIADDAGITPLQLTQMYGHDEAKKLLLANETKEEKD